MIYPHEAERLRRFLNKVAQKTSSLCAADCEEAAALEAWLEDKCARTERDHAYAEAAKEAFVTRCDDNDFDIDDCPVVSAGDDPGAYVSIWMWVTNEEAGLENNEDD